MAKRFTEQVSIQPQNLSTGFVQGSNSLLNRLQQFKSSTERLVDTVETKRGQEEAQEVQLEKEGGITKAPKKKEAGVFEKILTGGVSANAYNKTLETAYLASIGNDTKEAIAEIEARNPDNTAKFNDEVNSRLSGILKGVDPSVKQQVQQFAEGHISNARVRVNRKNILKNKNEAIAQTSEAITSFSNEAATLAREGNMLGAAESAHQSFVAIDGLVESGDLASDKAANMKREIDREMTEQARRKEFDDLVESEGIEAAFKELEDISNKPSKGWTPDEWDTYIASQQADLRQDAIRLAQVDSEQKIQTSKEVSNLKIKAGTGVDLQGNPVAPSEIIKETEKLFNEGKINGSTRASIITSTINGQKKQLAATVTKDKVASKLAGAVEIPLTQDEIDLAWDEDYAPALDNLPTEVKGAAITNFVNSTKIVPTQVLKQVNNNLNSGNPDLVIESASLMDRLDSIRGIPETNFTPNDRAFAESVVELSQNMDPVEAVKLARENTNPNDQARINARKELLKEDKKAWTSSSYKSVIENAFDPWIGGTTVDPISSDQMTKEYAILYEQHFLAGMGKDAAQEKALQLIKRNWKDSSAVGPTRAMKYRPEDYYDVAGNTRYIGSQVYKATVDNNVFPFEFSKEDMRLISDDTTARESATGKPSYLVMIDRGEEGLFPVAGYRFVPDVQTEVKRQQNLNREQLNKGRKASTAKSIIDIGQRGGF